MFQKLTLLLPALFISSMLFAQQADQTSDNTLEGQFVEVVDGSNNYQEFKVIKKVAIEGLRKNILDTVSKLETKIVDANTTINTQKGKIESLEKNLGRTEEDLSLSREKEDGISLFGILMSKTGYNTLMWSIIGGLLLALLFFVYKYKNSHAVTKQAQLKLAETEIEFEAHRQKKLEEIQQTRRKLQDEINKNRKSAQ